jgi:hypothetical protein
MPRQPDWRRGGRHTGNDDDENREKRLERRSSTHDDTSVAGGRGTGKADTFAHPTVAAYPGATVTTLAGDNTARVVQLVARFRW